MSNDKSNSGKRRREYNREYNRELFRQGSPYPRCRRCGKLLKKDNSHTMASLVVYCAKCADIIAERRMAEALRKPQAARRIYRRSGGYTEYRGQWPALIFAGRDVEEVLA